MQSFIQPGPQLKNQYEHDPVLRSYLKRKVDQNILKKIEPDLKAFGKRVVDECLDLSRAAQANPPSVTHYSPWGERIDEINVCEAWKKLDRISAEEGLIAIGYEREQGEFSRLYQFAKLYLFHPSSAIYTCPLAMTDGAAKLLEAIGGERLMKRAFERLTSRDPLSFWTSGQWMTEQTGGSDVRRTQTVAIKNDKSKDKDEWELSGIKWFSSATTSQMAMTLAREESADGPISLFYLETHKEDGSLNNIEVMRLKDKLGTKSLPTAELKLNGAKAIRVGEPGKGIKNISLLFNVTRIFNALCAVANMRRIIALSTDYSKKREAFGKKLIEHRLHRQTLFETQTEYIGCFHLVFKCVELLGLNESETGSDQSKKLLRLLTPLAKLYTGKRGVEIASEMVESFGGAGYVEDTGIPVILRDAQVLAIWEGTTNILSLDTLRSILKEDTLGSLFADIERIKETVKSEIPGDATLVSATQELVKISSTLLKDPAAMEKKARDFSFALAHVYIGWLLREAVNETNQDGDHPVYVKSYALWTRRFEKGLLKNDDSYEVSKEDLIC